MDDGEYGDTREGEKIYFNQLFIAYSNELHVERRRKIYIQLFW
jgi:hypothetical protein